MRGPSNFQWLLTSQSPFLPFRWRRAECFMDFSIFFNKPGGIKTVSIPWITPLLAVPSAEVTVACWLIFTKSVNEEQHSEFSRHVSIHWKLSYLCQHQHWAWLHAPYVRLRHLPVQRCTTYRRRRDKATLGVTESGYPSNAGQHQELIWKRPWWGRSINRVKMLKKNV